MIHVAMISCGCEKRQWLLARFPGNGMRFPVDDRGEHYHPKEAIAMSNRRSPHRHPDRNVTERKREYIEKNMSGIGKQRETSSENTANHFSD